MISTKLFVVAWLFASAAATGVDRDERRTTLRYALRQEGVALDSASLFRAVQDDERPAVRSLAAELLTSLAEPGIASLLRARLPKDTDTMVRAHFAMDLLQLEGGAALSLAHSTLEKLTDPSDRLALAGPLAELGDFSGYADVGSGAKSSVAPLQLAAASELRAFVSKCRPCDLSPPPIDLALSLLDAKLALVRLYAAMAVDSRLRDDPRVEVALRKIAATEQDDLVRNYVAATLRVWEREKKRSAGGPR
jgi:hypothetical protein